MASAVKNEQPATPAEDVDAEIARIGAMSVAELRRLWPKVFGAHAPDALSNDLLVRALAYRLQEQAYGGLKPQTLRLLRAVLTQGEPPRQVKVGSVIVREHKGVLHEVMVVPGGFCWRGQTYDSLSTVAKKITGTNWNGPRFFGLRDKKGDACREAPTPKTADKATRGDGSRRSGRHSSVRMRGAA